MAGCQGFDDGHWVKQFTNGFREIVAEREREIGAERERDIGDERARETEGAYLCVQVFVCVYMQMFVCVTVFMCANVCVCAWVGVCLGVCVKEIDSLGKKRKRE